ncbi:MAG: hypothetical protein KDJ88_17400 [Bauldia sp.]|nr:hypothetical protein [Bauldia sp.]
MSGAETGALEDRSTGTGRQRSPLARAILTVVVFACLGPLIGGLIAIVGVVIFGFEMTDPHMITATAGPMILYGLWLAYPTGLVPAIVAGAIVAAVDYSKPRVNALMAAAIGLAIGIVWLGLGGHRPEGDLAGNLIMIGCVVATVCCWWLRRRPQS